MKPLVFDVYFDKKVPGLPAYRRMVECDPKWSEQKCYEACCDALDSLIEENTESGFDEVEE